MNRSVKILGILLILLMVAGAIVYFLWFAPQDGNTPNLSLPEWLSGNNDGTSSSQINGTENEGVVEVPANNVLVRISKEPVAGFVLVPSENGTEHVRFIERATGNFFESPLSTSEVIRLSNTTIPQVIEASFTKSGSRAALRYLSQDGHTINTYLAQVPTAPVATSTEQEDVTGVFLPDNVIAVTPHPSSDSFFYLAQESNGVRGFIISSNVPGSQVFSSPIREWSAHYVTPSTVSLSTKPSAEAYGFSYLLNTSNGSLTRLLGYINGLTVSTHASAQLALYSATEERSFSLHSLDTNTNEPNLFPIATFPEKCAWSKVNPNRLYCAFPKIIPPAQYPDAWYRGEISFEDELWVIDIVENDGEPLTPFDEFADDLKIDLIDPQLSQNDDYLVFRNKRDGSLWSYNLPEAFE
jgi:hypothetical protein